MEQYPACRPVAATRGTAPYPDVTIDVVAFPQPPFSSVRTLNAARFHGDDTSIRC